MSDIIVIFILGTVLMRSAGCVANDMLDRKFDSYVARTKLRPLANQSIPVKNAFFLLITLLLGALICVLFLNKNGADLISVSAILNNIKRLQRYPSHILQSG